MSAAEQGHSIPPNSRAVVTLLANGKLAMQQQVWTLAEGVTAFVGPDGFLGFKTDAGVVVGGVRFPIIPGVAYSLEIEGLGPR